MIVRIVYLTIILIGLFAVINRSFGTSCAVMDIDVVSCDARCTLTPFCQRFIKLSGRFPYLVQQFSNALFGMSVLIVATTLTLTDKNRHYPRLCGHFHRHRCIGRRGFRLFPLASIGPRRWSIYEVLFYRLQEWIGTVAIVSIALNLCLAVANRLIASGK